jgi:ATP/ADP translocase/HEAT repeat protein
LKRRLFDIREGEQRYALAGFFAFFGILCAHQMLETARDALFLASIPASKLPWMYIAIAILASAIAYLQRLGSRSGKQDCRPLVGLLVVSSAITVGFYFLVEQRTFLTLSSLYVWTSVMNAVVLVSLWTLAGTAFSTPQARRIFPFMGVGSVMGAITGTGIARYLTSVLDAQALILGAAIFLLITGVAVAPWLHGTGGEDKASDERDTEPTKSGRRAAPLTKALSTRYARAIIALVVVGVLCTTMADFVFKSIVADIVPADELGSFFATVYLVTNSLSFIVQVFVAERMIRKLGLLPAVAALPAALLMGGVTVTAGFPVVGALVLVAADGALEHSLYRTALEILYVPFKPAVRRRIKEALELVLRNSGKAVASLALLGLLALGVDIRWIAAVTLALSVGWIVVAFMTRREYVDHYRDALREQVISGSSRMPDLDISSTETLLAELSDPDEERALGTLRLLQSEGMENLIPPLILYHPSLDVVDFALEIFVEERRKGIVELADNIILHGGSKRLRARVLRARTLIEPNRELLEQILHDDCDVCRSTASLLLATHGWLEQEETVSIIEETLESGSELARESLALALGNTSNGFIQHLKSLALDSSDLVRGAAVQSLGKRQSPEALSILLELLSEDQSSQSLRSAIAQYGNVAVEEVETWLERKLNNVLLRRALISVLGKVATEYSASVLQRELANEDNGVIRYRIIREMELVSRTNPKTAFDEQLLREVRTRLLERLAVSNDMSERAHRYVEFKGDEVGEEWRLLVDLVDSRDTNHFEVVLRLSALIDPKLDADTLMYAMAGGDTDQRTSAREILDSSLPSNTREAIRVTIERLFETGANRTLDEVEDQQGVDELLEDFLEHPSGTVRQVARRIAEQERFKVEAIDERRSAGE